MSVMMSAETDGASNMANPAHQWLVLAGVWCGKVSDLANEFVLLRKRCDFLKPVANFLAEASSHETAMSTGCAHGHMMSSIRH